MSTPKFLSLEAIQKQTNTCLDDLPDELLVEILARVPSATSMYPAKETAHLRTVSRSWNSIISSAAFIPHFISFGKENNCSWGNGETLLFEDFSLSTVRFYLVLSQCDLTVMDQPALDFSYISDETYVIAAASDDLLLLRECPSEGPLFVCNPFTKRWAALPNRLKWGPNFSLVCDPQGHRYRVISTEWWGEGEGEGEVFVSETGEWKEIFLTMDKFWSNILPFHGKFYWYNFDGHLVCYDPFEDSYSFFPDPDPDFVRDSEPEDTGYHGYSLSVVHGSIRMLKFSSPQPAGEEQFYDLICWELDFKQERWTLIYKSSLCSHSCDNADNGTHYIYQRPIAIHPDGHAVYFRANHGLAFHDLSKGSNSFSKVWVKDELEGRYPSYEAFLLTRPWWPTSACYGSSRLMNPDRKDDAMGMGGPWHLDLAGEKVKAGAEFRRICSHEEAGTSRGGSFEQTVNQRLMTSTSILSQHEDAIQPLPYIPVSTSNKIFKSKVVKAALMVSVYLQILQLTLGFKVVLHYTPHKILGKACRLSVVLYRRSDLVSLLISVLTILLMLLCIRGR